MLLYFGLGLQECDQALCACQLRLYAVAAGCEKKYEYYLDFHKYKHNFDYQLALLIMNSKYYMSSDPLIFVESDSFFPQSSQVHFEYYQSQEHVADKLENNTDIQCVIGNGLHRFWKGAIAGINGLRGWGRYYEIFIGTGLVIV